MPLSLESERDFSTIYCVVKDDESVNEDVIQ